MPAAVQEALNKKIKLPDDVVEALPETHRRVVRSYMRLIAPVISVKAGGAPIPTAKKVYKP